MLKKKPKKPDKTIRDLLYDWDRKEILLSHNVYSRHLAEVAHDEAYEYYETLKANLAHPESVKLSPQEAIMNRVDIETSLLQQIHSLPDEQLVEVSKLVAVLSDRLPPPKIERKLSFVEFIRHSPLCDVELELDRDGSSAN